MSTPKRTAQHHGALPWTTQDIDDARSSDLAPILARRGYHTTPLPNGAVLLRDFRGLIINGNRWTWASEGLQGNTIDFFITLEGKTFTQAIAIARADDNDTDDEP
jgi:hypothetical protein